MRPLSEIEADMISLGRPSMADFEAGNIKALHALFQRQQAWAVENPGAGAKWAELRREADNAHEAEDEHRMALAESSRLLQRLGDTVGELTLEGIPRAIRDPREAMKAAQDFNASAVWALTLVGGVGTGKTVPAAWLAKQALERGDTLTWWRAPSFAALSMFGPEADARVKRACHAKLFVLDDMGAEMTTGPWVAVLENVLGFRHAHKAKTVVTGNLVLESQDPSIPSLRALLKDRLYDRLMEGVVVGTGRGSLRPKRVAA